MSAQRSPRRPDLWEEPKSESPLARRSAPRGLHTSDDALPCPCADELFHTAERVIFDRASTREPDEVLHALATVSDRFEHALAGRDVSARPSPSEGQAHVASGAARGRSLVGSRNEHPRWLLASGVKHQAKGLPGMQAADEERPAQEPPQEGRAHDLSPTMAITPPSPNFKRNSFPGRTISELNSFQRMMSG